MSVTAIFIVGALVFAVTVYGTVVAGIAMLSRAQVQQNPRLREGADEKQLSKRVPFRLKF